MKKSVLGLVAMVMFVATAAVAHAQSEGYILDQNGGKHPGITVWRNGEKFFYDCPRKASFSLAKYPMTVVNEEGACSGSISVNSAHGDVLADCRQSSNPEQCEKDKAEANAREEKARQRARYRLRKLLEESGYDVDQADVQ
jgi:hypothetical protein